MPQLGLLGLLGLLGHFYNYLAVPHHPSLSKVLTGTDLRLGDLYRRLRLEKQALPGTSMQLCAGRGNTVKRRARSSTASPAKNGARL